MTSSSPFQRRHGRRASVTRRRRSTSFCPRRNSTGSTTRDELLHPALFADAGWRQDVRMDLALLIVGILLILGAGFSFTQQGRALTGTVVGAIGILATVAGWVLLDGAATLSEAFRTGGLAAASVVLLYALWMADRRRRID